MLRKKLRKNKISAEIRDFRDALMSVPFLLLPVDAGAELHDHEELAQVLPSSHELVDPSYPPAA